MPPNADGSYSGVTAPAVDDRMIVRTGQLALVVDDITGVLGKIAALADQLKGFVVSSNSWRDNERLHGTITIRVPADTFNDTMTSIGKMAAEITSQTTSATDVTQEYTDLGARLQTLEATEKQLLQILQKAEKIEDILAVQRELTNVRSQIEQIKGRMLYLERTSSMSLITVSLEQSKLEVKFNADKAAVKKGESVRFFAQIAGGFTPYSYQWDFGDGSTSTDAVPAHDYRATGTYTVTLNVTDDRKNTDSEVRKDYITVLPGWRPGTSVSSAWNGLSVFGRVLADIAIWLGIFSPVWIIGGGIFYWFRYRRKKKA